MACRAQDDYARKALDTMGRKCIVISPDLKILVASSMARKESDSEFQGRFCYEYLHGKDKPCQGCPVMEVLKSRISIIRSKREPWVLEEGNFCLRVTPLFNDGEIEAISIVDMDFASVGGLEYELKRSNAFLRNLIMSSVDGVVAADRKGKILIFNEAAAEITGYSVEEALNDLNIVNLYPDGCAREVMRKLRGEEDGGKGKLKSYQLDLLNKDGTAIPISLSAAIVYEGDREVATVGFFCDLRERHRMEDELRKTQTQLVQADKMASLGKLAAGVAHQLNNPLGGITLYAQLIMEEYSLEGGAHDDLKRIMDDAERCKNIVKELLEFGRQTRQEIRLNDINRSISRTLFLLENQSLFHDIEIIKEFDADLPMVPSDIQQLNHVFMNIILNAAGQWKAKAPFAFEPRLQGLTMKAYVLTSRTQAQAYLKRSFHISSNPSSPQKTRAKAPGSD